MIVGSQEEWFEKQLQKLKKDPCFWMEYRLMQIEAEYEKHHGKAARGIDRMLFNIIEWAGNKLIIRSYQTPNKSSNSDSAKPRAAG